MPAYLIPRGACSLDSLLIYTLAINCPFPEWQSFKTAVLLQMTEIIIGNG